MNKDIDRMIYKILGEGKIDSWIVINTQAVDKMKNKRVEEVTSYLCESPWKTRFLMCHG